jgi:hypothetical protein
MHACFTSHLHVLRSMHRRTDVRLTKKGSLPHALLRVTIQHFESQPGYKPAPAKMTGKAHKIC